MAGVAGLEPTHADSETRALPTWRYPYILLTYNIIKANKPFVNHK